MRKTQHNGKRIAATVLSAIMALSLAACGGKGNKSTDNTKEYVYVPEYIEMKDTEHANLYNMQMSGNNMYYFSYNYDEATMMGSNALFQYSLDSMELKQLPVTFGEQRDVNSFDVDKDGNLYTVEYKWDYSEDFSSSSEEHFLCKYDAQGNKLYEQNITDIVKQNDEYGYIGSLMVDDKGRCYANSDQKLRLFDEQGNYAGDVTVDTGWIQQMGTGKDGKIYISYYDGASGNPVLGEVVFEQKQLGKVYQNFPSGNGNGKLAVGVEGDFLVNDGTRVYEYDLKKQESSEILKWLDCDINGNHVNYVGALENGKLFVVIDNWDTGVGELATLTKTKASELPQKVQLTIGTLYEDSALQSAAVAFNKQSDTYRININTYMDADDWSDTSYTDALTRLNNDITSGANCPDILAVASLDVAQLAAKGAFEDLNPYFEKSSQLSKDDYLDSIIEAYTFDGKLITVPKTFTLSTIAGKSSELGEEMGWTLTEMMDYAKQHPDASIFDNSSKLMMMYYLLNFNQDSFVNWSTGECSFDSDEFKQTLEFIASFPDEVDWMADERSTPTKIQAGDVLLNMADIYELNSIQEYDAMFNEKVTFIGYPNSNGESGCYLAGNEMYAMAAKSQNKDGAWAFIEYYLAQEESDYFSWGLPSNKEQMELKIANETKVEYILDENGEKILDENGEPIIANAGGGIGYGDWEYTYHITTQEEVDRVLELIEVARPAYTANEEIMKIIQEEADAYFKGQKTVDDVAGIIQSRVEIYVKENS